MKNKCKCISKKCIDQIVNGRMIQQKRNNTPKALFLGLICLLGFICFFYWLYIWRYSISLESFKWGKVSSIIFKTKKVHLIHERCVLTIFFTMIVFPIFSFLNASKNFGVFRIKTQQNKKFRAFVTYFLMIFQIVTSLSLSLEVVVSRSLWAAFVLLFVSAFIVISFFIIQIDNYNSNFHCDKYLNKLKNKGFKFKCPNCKFCNFNTYDYRSLFKEQCHTISNTNIINISNKDFYNLTDNMF